METFSCVLNWQLSRSAQRNASQIVLPERVKLRLDAQVASKAAEAKRKAEMKQDRHHVSIFSV